MDIYTHTTMGLPLRTQTSTLLVYWQEESMISGARYQRVTTYLRIYGVTGVVFSRDGRVGDRSGPIRDTRFSDRRREVTGERNPRHSFRFRHALGEVARLVGDAAREAEVGDLEVAVGVDQDVGRLQVPVGVGLIGVVNMEGSASRSVGRRA